MDEDIIKGYPPCDNSFKKKKKRKGGKNSGSNYYFSLKQSAKLWVNFQWSKSFFFHLMLTCMPEWKGEKFKKNGDTYIPSFFYIPIEYSRLIIYGKDLWFERPSLSSIELDLNYYRATLAHWSNFFLSFCTLLWFLSVWGMAETWIKKRSTIEEYIYGQLS